MSDKEKSYQKEPLNSSLANLMNTLADIMSKKGEPMKARAYSKAEETILGSDPFYSPDDLKGKPGIGITILSKIKEYLEKGKLDIIEREHSKPEYLFANIYGIGSKKAKELVAQGIDSLESLKSKKEEVLNKVQQVGLQYYEDILERIPRAEIDKYNDIFRKAVPKSAKYEIVGSYRRGQLNSGDIDMILTSENPADFDDFLDRLIEQGVIAEVLSRGKTKCLVIANIPQSNKYRRVDFLYTNSREYPFAVLYFTGSKGFNERMRAHALTKGYSLNEHGFSLGKKGEKLDREFKDERDIFDFLGLQYKEPTERIDGRSIIILEKPTNISVKTSLDTIGERMESKTPEQVGVLMPESLQKPKRKYTRKVKPVEEIKKSPSPVKIEKKQKRKYTRRVKPVEEINKSPSPIPSPVKIEEKTPSEKKQKRKYTRKVKPVVEAITIPSPIETKEKTPSPIRTVIKVKRKYTRKPKEQPIEQNKCYNEFMKCKAKEELSKDINNSPVSILSGIPSQPMPSLPKQEKQDKKQKKKSSENKIKEKIEEFKTSGFSILSKYTKTNIQEMIRVCKDSYYNESISLITDNEYDILEEFYKANFEKGEEDSLETGAPIQGKNKVQLPFEMASMDKIKPDSNILTGWVSKYKGPYVLSCKLDGVSGLYICDDSGKHSLYTRGDGHIGQDISHLIKPLGLPKIPAGTAIRGEFILKKSVFQEKYKEEFANARNLVSGMVNRKGVDSKSKDLDYVTYEVISPIMIPSEQLLYCKQLGLTVVQHQVVDTLSNEYLSAVLVDWRTNYIYEIDGVIVTDNGIHPRGSGNPDHAFAFKMVLSDQVAEAKVVDVLWNPSKDGYLKPRVRIEPIQLAGVKIEYATGFNGKFIEDNKIGLGAIITMVRSGDVIPYIKSVTVPADKPLMPQVKYRWTDTLVDIVLENAAEDTTVLEKNITNFFVSLDVDGLSSGNVKRMMATGFHTIHSILLAKKEDLLKVDGFKQKMVDKIYDSIQEKVSKASLLDIVVASGKLGRGLGKRKVGPILEKYPDIFTSGESNDQKIAMLREVDGIGNENSREFVENIPNILEFLKITELEHKLLRNQVLSETQGQEQQKQIVDTGHPFFGKKIVMTKTRDKDIILYILEKGGMLEESMKKDTFLLIVKSVGDTSSKTEYAKKNGIDILSVDEFKEKYL
jgi:NAD-dependent DNA ligase